MINKVILVGNLGHDPDVSYTPSGTAKVRFSLATSERWRDKSTGELEERTEWHRVIAWGKVGESCAEYLSKGRQVYVEGRLQTRQWEKDGVTKYTTEVIATEIKLLGSRGGDRGAHGAEEEPEGPPLPGDFY